jgi:hypothetical protein
VLAELKPRAELMAFPTVVELSTVVTAEDARLAGRPLDAIKLLKPLLTGHERYQTRVALREAYADAGQIELALDQSRWLARRRGLAYIELGFGHCLQALNVADSNLSVLRDAELLARSGRATEARQALKDFSRLWPAEVLPNHLKQRYSAAVVASN